MLTAADLRALFPRADVTHLFAFAERNGALFERYAIAAPAIRLFMFLAQIGHESAGLTVFSENLSYSAGRMMAIWPHRFTTLEAALPYAHQPEKLANAVYGGRMGNGSACSGDGWRYRGRGLIQLTGRSAYTAVGQHTGLDLEGEPDLAQEPEHALHVACGLWAWMRLNCLADTGDVVRVTRKINGGLQGLADRRVWLDRVSRILAARSKLAEQPDSGQIAMLQRALHARGYTEVGAADGLYGPRTAAALCRARADLGLPDGGIDAPLWQALQGSTSRRPKRPSACAIAEILEQALPVQPRREAREQSYASWHRRFRQRASGA